MKEFGKRKIHFNAIKINDVTEKMFKIMQNIYKKYSNGEIIFANLNEKSEFIKKPGVETGLRDFIAGTASKTISNCGSSSQFSLENLISRLSKSIASDCSIEDFARSFELLSRPKSSFSFEKISHLQANLEVIGEDAPIMLNYKITEEKPNWNGFNTSVLNATCYNWYIKKDKQINWENPNIIEDKIKTQVQISKLPFSQGNMRFAFYMRDISLGPKYGQMVAKLPKKVDNLYSIEEMKKDIFSVRLILKF